ncbi:MAG: hypothetical protein HOE78_18990 [Gammaproteobacteria bacterium]|jgi:hypothetical protein|nr:hypothetical protein [Gammaproteobacteria bacterium]
MSFDWKSLVKTVAPVLGTALGGPFGGMATKAISNALLGEDETTTGHELENKISEVLQRDPESLLKLKKADQDFDTRMKELDVDILKIAADDRNSARDLQKVTKSWIVPLLATVTVACFFAVVFWVLSGKVTLESTLLGFVLGQVSSKAEQVYNFFFGSSAGSKEKTTKLRAR